VADHEQHDAGRRRLIEHDRERDRGERRDEYQHGEWQQSDDPLAESRRQAMEANSRPRGDPEPGMTPRDEAWQREKQMTGQAADEPGKPRSWKQGDQAQRRPGAGDEAAAGRDGISVPSGDTDDHREDAGSGSGSEAMGRPLRKDELPDSGDVTQG
jgi:hypothetical protein